MKKQIIATATACCLLALPVLATEENTASPSAIDFDVFSPSEDGSFVEIRVNNGLINMAARLAETSEPEVAKILGGLKSIRVNVIKFEEGEKGEKKKVTSRIESIRKQLDDQEWERVVRVKEDNEDVGIYAKLKGDESIEGVVVTVIEENEAVLIHVDGSIRPEELAQVGERLNIEPLKHLGESLDLD